jgi:hypothetical protein
MKKEKYACTNPLILLMKDAIFWSVGMVAGVGTVTFFLPGLSMPLVTMIAILWSIYCAKLLVRDLIQTLRASVLYPLIDKASTYSLDDIFCFVFDPRHLLSYITGMWLCPILLYSLPTTSEQRAQVLHSTGVLHHPSVSHLTVPGGWKKLLPVWFQRWINDFSSSPTLSQDESKNVQEDSSSDDEEDDTSEESLSHCASSPNYRQTEEHTKHNHNHREPQEILVEIVTHLLQEKASALAESIQEKRMEISCTMIISSIILVLQVTHSATARRNLLSIAHLLVSIFSAAGLSGSVIAILLPQIYWRKENFGQNIQRIRGVFSNTNNFPTWMTSSMITAALSLTTYSGERRKLLLQMMQKWKGLIAIILFFYFERRRHRRQVENQ